MVREVPTLSAHLSAGASPGGAASDSPSGGAAAGSAPGPPAAGASGGERGEPSHSIAEFLAATAERDRPGDVFELEGAHMLEAHVNGRVWSKLGAMVAYRGQLKFVREGAFEGGLGRFVTKMVSGEVAPLTKIEGQGLAYLAHAKKNITVLRLEPADAINVNGNDVLAFEDSVRYQITVHRRVAGMLAGGLFSLRLVGPGLVAIVSHGAPLDAPLHAVGPGRHRPERHRRVVGRPLSGDQDGYLVSAASWVEAAARPSRCSSAETASWSSSRTRKSGQFPGNRPPSLYS